MTGTLWGRTSGAPRGLDLIFPAVSNKSRWSGHRRVSTTASKQHRTETFTPMLALTWHHCVMTLARSGANVLVDDWGKWCRFVLQHCWQCNHIFTNKNKTLAWSLNWNVSRSDGVSATRRTRLERLQKSSPKNVVATVKCEQMKDCSIQTGVCANTRNNDALSRWCQC